jgi:hypothetical protein
VLTAGAIRARCLPLLIPVVCLAACEFGLRATPVREDVLSVRIVNESDQVVDVSYRYLGARTADPLIRVGPHGREQVRVRIRGLGILIVGTTPAGRQALYRQIMWDELERGEGTAGRSVEVVVY